MKDAYHDEVPRWLRMLGCWAIKMGVYCFRWGEFTPDWGLKLEYTVYHDSAHIAFSPGWGRWYFKVPMIINQRPGTEDWNATYGFTFHSCAAWWHWRTKTYCRYLPWHPELVRQDVLQPDGSWAPYKWSLSNDPAKDGRLIETHPFTYVTSQGEVQEREATAYVTRYEHRWRWFKWLPLTKRVSHSIHVDLNAETGEGIGSWKGGTYGWASEIGKDESIADALKRFEQDKRLFRA